MLRVTLSHSLRKRVFILGPSHHVYIQSCALSACESYATPLGSLPLDRESVSKFSSKCPPYSSGDDLAIDELKSTGKFETMSQSTDEDEHSIELHLPYVRKIFEGLDIQIVPILIGAINKDAEATFGALLAPYLAREDTFTVVSSDFCHWYVLK